MDFNCIIDICCRAIFCIFVLAALACVVVGIVLLATESKKNLLEIEEIKKRMRPSDKQR